MTRWLAMGMLLLVGCGGIEQSIKHHHFHERGMPHSHNVADEVKPADDARPAERD